MATRPDVLVIGAGAFGLSVGWAARLAGLSVRVLEARQVGAGASGGPVGALAPHAPGRWGPLHAFQLAALAALPGWVAALEAATGRATGYARPGRLVPLGTEAARARAEADAEAAPARWGAAGRLEVLDALPEEESGWISPGLAAFGVARDTLSARIRPEAYLAALAAALDGAVETGVAVRGIDPDGPAVLTDSGRLSARAVVIAAGWQSWAMAAPLFAGPAPMGSAVKGQAALLAHDAPGRKLITGSGLYVVPHARCVAVGSTSEAGFDDPAGTDGQLDALIARARALCPLIASAPVLLRWAGLRPRPPGRLPVVGRLPWAPGVWIASGGFRIGLGIAHAVGAAVVAGIAGDAPQVPLPDAFRPGAAGPARAAR